MVKALRFLSHLFGFEKLTPNEKDYLHESNKRASIYMGFIVMGLEVWMLIRQIKKRVIVKVKEGQPLFDMMVKYTSKYWLFLLIGLGLMIFCIFFTKKRKKISKPAFITLMVSGALCFLYSFVIFIENFTKVNAAAGILEQQAFIMNFLMVMLYVLTGVIGVSIIIYSIFKYYKNKSINVLEHVIIASFTIICLDFGFFVSYSDFMQDKEIICYLTMILYVGCLLIYRPYISMLILLSSFYGFYLILTTFEGGKSFAPVDGVISGDSVNYVTFLVSLITICFAIYHGRLNEAKKTHALEISLMNDSLTGLLNYNYFTERAKEVIETSNDISNDVFLFLDIYNFKSFNDQRGFEAGNKFLVSVGKFLTEVFDTEDREVLISRQADDHYLVLTSKENIEEKLNVLKEKVKSLDEEILLSIHVGGYSPHSNTEDPRKCIDRARYAAERIKKNLEKIYLEYDKKMHEEYHKRLYILNNIDNAVANGWITPYYQVVVWSKDKEICGCEALARWIDPTYGQLYPNEFIPVLEEYSLIHKLDRCIIERVCQDLRAGLDSNKPVFPVSINFSRLDFELMDAVNELETIVQKYKIPKELIHVEVTESALIDSFDLLSVAISQLKDLGYSIWLDDFGSGYSSLNVLKDYSFDVIKIDMRFLSNLDKSEKSKILIDCIIQMATRIDMLTLTEGVETMEEADFLNKVGCGRLQGYLFGKPVPKEVLYKRIEDKELTVSKNCL